MQLQFTSSLRAVNCIQSQNCPACRLIAASHVLPLHPKMLSCDSLVSSPVAVNRVQSCTWTACCLTTELHASSLVPESHQLLLQARLAVQTRVARTDPHAILQPTSHAACTPCPQPAPHPAMHLPISSSPTPLAPQSLAPQSLLPLPKITPPPAAANSTFTRLAQGPERGLPRNAGRARKPQAQGGAGQSTDLCRGGCLTRRGRPPRDRKK